MRWENANAVIVLHLQGSVRRIAPSSSSTSPFIVTTPRKLYSPDSQGVLISTASETRLDGELCISGSLVCTCSPLLSIHSSLPLAVFAFRSIDWGNWYDKVSHRHHWYDSAGAINPPPSLVDQLCTIVITRKPDSKTGKAMLVRRHGLW